jgi:hypothetical protein
VRNEALSQLDTLVGEWDLTLSDAFFLDEGRAVLHGSASIEWLDDAFLVMRGAVGNADYLTWTFVFGRSDSDDEFIALSHDERGTNRVFGMTFGDGEWTLLREDRDFHQRFVASVEPERISGRWEASEDQGSTWRKDFDLTYQRRTH